jgi:hypothetical protein
LVVGNGWIVVGKFGVALAVGESLAVAMGGGFEVAVCAVGV